MKIKKYLHISILLVAIYLGFIFANILVPRVQIYLDLANFENYGVVESFVYDEEYRTLSSGSDGRYHTEYEIYGNLLNVSFEIKDGLPADTTINNQQFTKVDKISDYTSADVYKDTFVLKADVVGGLFYPSLIVFSIIFILIFEFILNKVLLNKVNRLDKLVYSKSAIASVGKKTIFISFIATVISLIIYHGCDLQPIVETLKLSSSGIDIYQLFACLNKYKNVNLFLWQYDGMMLAFYNVANFINYLPFKFTVVSYHWAYTILHKLINIVLLNLTAISMVSFMIGHNIISKEKSKSIYLWSVLNPVTFYVSVVFIQYDALPLYFITLGILLLDNIDENKILPFVLVAFGLACKIPMMMCMPVIGMMGLYFLFKSKGEKFVKLIANFAVFGFVMFIIFLAPRLVHAPIEVAYRNMTATQRMWWTTIQYAPVVFLFVTTMVIEIFLLLNYTKFNLSVSVVDLIQNSLFIIATLIFGFSFSVMSTPGIFIVTMPAFALMYARQEDNLQRFIFGFGGLLMVVYVLFSSIGDISATSIFFGGRAYLTEIEKMYSGTPTGTQINSVLHTVSNSAMLAYAIIFFKEAGKHFKKHKKVEEI